MAGVPYLPLAMLVTLLITKIGSGLPVINLENNFYDSSSDYNDVLSGDYDINLFDIRQLSNVNNRFALDLYQAIAEDSNEENIFFSPISVSNSLAMTYLGSSGNTSQQIREVIGFGPMDDLQIHRSFRGLNDIIRSSLTNSCALQSANRMYVMENASLRKQFIDDAEEYYNATAKSLDFVAERRSARQAINSWVKEQTKGKIKSLIGRNDLSAMTVLVLVNAVYFKGEWDHQFRKRLTKPRMFHTSDNVSVQVTMMHQVGRFPYGFDSVSQCDVIELPYSGKQVSMMIALPRLSPESNGLASLESQLTPETFQRWSMVTQIDQKVDVYLPKFSLNEDVELDSVLKKMGIKDLFDIHKADLSGVCENSTLYVSKANHQTCIDVDEEGSEATAATSFIMTGRSRSAEMNINRPFLFYIRHNPTDTVLFIGRVTRPSTRIRSRHNDEMLTYTHESKNNLPAQRAPPIEGRSVRSRVGRFHEGYNKIRH